VALIPARKKKSFSAAQRLLVSVNTLVVIVVAAAILGGAWYLASLPQFRMRWDLTKEQSFSLTPRTKAILAGLEKDVEIILIFKAPDPRDVLGLTHAEKKAGDYTLDLLKEYEIHSRGKVRVEDLDFVRDNLRAGEILQELGIAQVNIVIVKSGDSRKVLIPTDLAGIDRGRVNRRTNVVRRAEIVSYKAEAALTAAVLEVTEERKPLACILAGRGEASMAGTNHDGLSLAAAGLRNTNFEVRELKLALNENIPHDCDVLIVPGPEDEYRPGEMAAITRYLEKGGNLFLALNPYSCTSFDKEILPAFGVALAREVTCRIVPEAMGGKDREIIFQLPVEKFSNESRITSSFAENDFYVLFYKAGSLMPAPGGLDNLTVKGLAYSHSEVWGDTHLPNEWGDFTCDDLTEKRGERLIGLSCEGKGSFRGSRLVLFADSFFYSNRALQVGSRGNLLLFTNSINWLAARETQLDIGPKLPYESRVELLPEEIHGIGFYVMVVIPAVALLLGLVVWWFRRR